MLVFVTSFALQLVDVSTNDVFPAVLWVSIFFMAVLALQRSFAKEVDSGALDALTAGRGRSQHSVLPRSSSSASLFCFCEAVIVPCCGFSLAWRGVKRMSSFCWPRSFGSWGLAAWWAHC